jgi:two-component system, NtrC family, response regulator AtoC
MRPASSPSAHAGAARAPTRAAGEPITLLVVDDDPLSARLLKANCDRPGRVRVEIASGGEEALRCLQRGGVDAVVSDLVMPEMDGIQLVERVRALDPTLPFIVLSGEATLERAVEAMRAGATDFLQKPVNVTVLTALVERALAERPLREEIRTLSERRAAATQRWLTGEHPRLDAVRAFAEVVAAAPLARVLITGESGTGKSLLARAIHDLSGATGRFTHLNCAALPAALLEAELFGYEKGAFTDARETRRGLIEASDRGTVFLDEIDTLPLELQAKLLVFLETSEVRRVGGVEPVAVRARVIAATAADLAARASEGGFRQDLLYRLDVAAVEMPPLREMPSVLPELARSFLHGLCAELGRPVPDLCPDFLRRLEEYPWPGNARELRNAVERALIFHREGPLELAPPRAHPSAAYGSGEFRIPLGLTLEEVEHRYLDATLARGGARQGDLAAALGISRKTLWEKRRRLGL